MNEAVVAVLTYRRNDDLAALLPELLVQIRTSSHPTTVLIVDNDPAAGAEPVAAMYAGPDVRYVHEPTAGIAAARNRALDEATGARYVIFIDDDERPRDGWLDALLSTVDRTGAAAVVGPVESIFEVEPDEFVSAGNFFRRRRPPTGTRLDVAATNNLLLDLPEIDRLSLRFDSAFGLSGGSDTLFTRRLAASGAAMVWCEEALVYDHVPAARVTRTWVLNRAFRSGNSWARTSIVLTDAGWPRLLERGRLAVRGGVRVLGGSAQYLLGRVRRDVAAEANGLRRFKRGAGMIAGIAGHVHVEYARSSA